MKKMSDKKFVILMRVLLVIGLMSIVASLSFYPVGKESDDSLLRLSWSFGEGRIKNCRDYTEDEKKRFPAHMRAVQFCESVFIPYHLKVMLDQTYVVDELVTAGGMKEDRPLVIARDVPLAPHQATLHVEFYPSLENQSDKSTSLPHYELSQAVEFKAGHIVYVDLNEETKKLVVY